MTSKKYILKTVYIIFASLITIRFLGFLFNSTLSKIITQSEYGAYTFAWSTAQLLTGILLLGVASATSYYIAYNIGKADTHAVNTYTKTAVVIITALTTLTIIIFFIINRINPDILSLSPPLMIFLFVMFAIHGIGFFFNLVINAHGRPEISAVFAIAFPLFATISLLFLRDFNSILTTVALSLFLQYILCFLYVTKNYDLTGSFSKPHATNLIKYGLSVILLDASATLMSTAGVYALKYYSDFTMVATFSAAFTITGVLLIIPHSTLSLYHTISCSLFGKNDSESLDFISSYIVEKVIMFMLPILSVLLLFPSSILKIVFTADYSAGSTALQLLSISILFTGIYQFFVATINASGQPFKNTRIMFIAAVFNITLSFILTGTYGIEGAAFSVLLTSILIATLTFIQLRKFIKIIIYKNRLLKIITSLLPPLTLAYLIKPLIPHTFLTLSLISVSLLTIYIIILLILKAFRSEDLSLLHQLTNNEKLTMKLKKFIS